MPKTVWRGNEIMASFVYPQEREDDQHLICEFRAEMHVGSEFFGGAAEVLIFCFILLTLWYSLCIHVMMISDGDKKKKYYLLLGVSTFITTTIDLSSTTMMWRRQRKQTIMDNKRGWRLISSTTTPAWRRHSWIHRVERLFTLLRFKAKHENFKQDFTLSGHDMDRHGIS